MEDRDEADSLPVPVVDALTSGNRINDWAYFSTKAICILSAFPLSEPFRRILTLIHDKSVNGLTKSPPIERLIVHFLNEIPLIESIPTRISIQYDPPIQANVLSARQSMSSFGSLLKCLGVEGFLLTLLAVLLEVKIIVHALKTVSLTPACESIYELIYPLQWQCAYVPTCPLGLAGILEAPFPFILGINTCFYDHHTPPDDVVAIDLKCKDPRVAHSPCFA
ncbi:hypothetical protein ACOME3_006835 [Neoechinorhynchus agilis]